MESNDPMELKIKRQHGKSDWDVFIRIKLIY